MNQLAKIDPLLAYQLSGRPQIDLNDTIDTFIERATELEGEKARTPTTVNAVDYFSRFLKSYGQRRMFTNMESDIIDVARQISYLTAFRTRRVIRHLTDRLEDEAEKYVDQFLDSLAGYVAQNSAVQVPAPKN